MDTLIFFKGFAISLGLIAAIGAQNAHVLRLGLTRQHTAWVVVLCIASDCLLIALGVAGAAWAFARFPWLVTAATVGGIVFLLAYGGMALRRAWQGGSALEAQAGGMPLSTALLTTLALTYLNPHVYLDTVVLVGSLAAAEGAGRWVFGSGAMLGSAIWFIALGVGARWLAPLFKTPLSWRVLDIAVGCTMLLLAAGLAARLM
jgi:L-lysine exporter family protein LysE/ArgO